MDSTINTVDAQAGTRQVELSIIMPCLNEAETLAICIRKAQMWLRDHDVNGEVLICDNGSADGSCEITVQMGARLVEVAERGYGAALMGGIAAAQGKYVIMGDCDDSYDFSSLESFVSRLREGWDLVMGNRFWGGIESGAMPPLHQYFGNPLLTGIARLLFGLPIGDIQCGLRGFNREQIQGLGLRTTGMEFASEMVVRSQLCGLRIIEVPTTLKPDGRSRKPHMRSFRDGWRNLRFYLIYSPNWLFLYPGAALVLAGTLLGALILPGPVVIGAIGFDANTLVFCSAAIVIGYQAIWFGVFTKTFASTERLIAQSADFNSLFKLFTLEKGLLVGIATLLIGGIGAAMAFSEWQRKDFGALSYAAMLRQVVPAATFLVLGSQTILSSFFVSVLGLKRL